MKYSLIPAFLAGCVSVQQAPNINEMSEEQFAHYLTAVEADAQDVYILVRETIVQDDLPPETLEYTATALRAVATGDMPMEQLLHTVEGYEGAILYIFLNRISRQMPDLVGERAAQVLLTIADVFYAGSPAPGD